MPAAMCPRALCAHIRVRNESNKARRPASSVSPRFQSRRQSFMQNIYGINVGCRMAESSRRTGLSSISCRFFVLKTIRFERAGHRSRREPTSSCSAKAAHLLAGISLYFSDFRISRYVQTVVPHGLTSLLDVPEFPQLSGSSRDSDS